MLEIFTILGCNDLRPVSQGSIGSVLFDLLVRINLKLKFKNLYFLSSGTKYTVQYDFGIKNFTYFRK